MRLVPGKMYTMKQLELLQHSLTAQIKRRRNYNARWNRLERDRHDRPKPVTDASLAELIRERQLVNVRLSNTRRRVKDGKPEQVVPRGEGGWNEARRRKVALERGKALGSQVSGSTDPSIVEALERAAVWRARTPTPRLDARETSQADARPEYAAKVAALDEHEDPLDEWLDDEIGNLLKE